MPRAADKENWSGMTFANNWLIIEKYNCAQSKALGLGGKNSHYAVYNTVCGVDTYMERTTIGDALEDKRLIMSKCKGCINGSKKLNGDCHWLTKVRKKPLYKVPDRTQKIFVGQIYNNFYVEQIKPAKEYADNQCRAIVHCIHCGEQQLSRFDAILNGTLTCDCFRPYSSGAKVIQTYLKQHNILYKSECTFEDLYGAKGRPLRYDFAVLDKNNNPIWLIEFDGPQHFEEAGTYFNKDGSLQIRDEIKNKYAKDNNIPLTRIPYTEILNISKILDKEKIKYI